jgi:zinc transport system substrate-binding protein
MRKSLCLVTLLGLLSSGPVLADPPPPRVVVSIKPLHGLVAAVMDGVAEPRLIVSGTASPHDYALKPSDARALEAAQLLVWVGKDFEAWLGKSARGAKAQLAMREITGMTVLETREGGVWEGEHHDHHHDQDEIDGHLWLDPDNAARLIDAVAVRLKSLDPAHAERYDANAARTRQRLSELDKTLATKLKPLAGKPYVVFHDAHHYFEARYGLNPVGAITIDPERPPSAKRMAALRDRLKASGAGCVFREPHFSSPAAQTLAEAAGARLGQLDPEGALVEPGPDAYFTTMTALADSLADCLSRR